VSELSEMKPNLVDRTCKLPDHRSADWIRNNEQCKQLDDSRVDDELAVVCMTVTDRTKPRRLLLVHTQVRDGIKTLQMVARHRPTWNLHTYLTQLHTHRFLSVTPHSQADQICRLKPTLSHNWVKHNHEFIDK